MEPSVRVIAGRVTNANGRALPGAWVELRATSGTDVVGATETDAFGEFELLADQKLLSGGGPDRADHGVFSVFVAGRGVVLQRGEHWSPELGGSIAIVAHIGDEHAIDAALLHYLRAAHSEALERELRGLGREAVRVVRPLVEARVSRPEHFSRVDALRSISGIETPALSRVIHHLRGRFERAELPSSRSPRRAGIPRDGSRAPSRRISGRVVTARGGGVSNASVQVVSTQLRAEIELTRGECDVTGTFALTYTIADDTEPDLAVRAYVDQELIGETRVEDAGPDERVQISTRTPGIGSVLEVTRAAVTAHLGGIALDSLTAEEVAFVARKAHLIRADLAKLVGAAALARELGGELEDAYAVFAAIAGGPTVDARALLETPPVALREAILRAASNDEVPPDFSTEPELRVRRLRAAAARNIMVRRATEIGSILAASGASEAAQLAVIERAASTRDLPDALTSLQDEVRVSEADAERIASATEIASIVDVHPPLVAAVIDRGIRTARELARWDEGEWMAVLDGGSETTRVPLPGKGAESGDPARRRYARELRERVERAFPMEVFIADLERDDRDPDARDLAAFMRADPSFSLASSDVDAHLERRPFAGDHSDAKTEAVRAMRRLWAVTPAAGRHGAVSALRRAGFDSASSIAAVRRARFVADHADALGGEDAAARVWDRSRARGEAVSVLLANSADRLGPKPGILMLPEPSREVADWETLFGAAGECCCAHCSSLLSPAAYFVALLRFLERGPTNDLGQTPLDVLFGRAAGSTEPGVRRADLGALRLTCTNTHSLVPYVDLVNEVLEAAVAEGLGAPPPFQTLATNGPPILPENTNHAAYDIIGSALYPWGLVDRNAAAIGGWLGALGSSPRSVLVAMEWGEPSLPTISAILGVSAHEVRLISRQLVPDHPSNAWGLSPQTALASLAALPELLARSELSVSQLEATLATRTLGGPTIHWGDDECDVSRATVDGLDVEWLEVSHRFLRLLRGLGWAPHELDHAVQVLGAGQIGLELLRKLSQLVELVERVGMTPLEALAWFGPIETRGGPGQPSLYQEVFGDIPDLALDDSGDELAVVGGELAPHSAALAAGLGLPLPDLDVLVQNLAPAALSIETVTTLYRHASMLHRARLTPTDFFTLTDLSGVDPFAGAADALRFVDAVAVAKDQPLPLERLHEIFRAPAMEPPAEHADSLQDLADMLAVAVATLAPDAVAEEIASASLSTASGWFADLAQLAKPTAELLLTLPGLSASGNPENAVLDDLLANPTSSVSSAGLGVLLRVAALIRPLDLDAKTLAWLTENAESHRWLDIRALVVADEAQPSLFLQWISLGSLIGLASNHSLEGDDLLDWLIAVSAEAAEAQQMISALAKLGPWPASDVELLLGASGWNVSTTELATLMLDERFLTALDRAFALTKRLNVPLAAVLSWLASPDSGAAENAMLAAKARFDAERWAKIARPIADSLRDLQRESLVKYLVATHPDIANAGDLYAHYLLDVEMSSCRLTSRIKSALASVQLFVQRALLNLEPVRFSGEDVREWEWLKNYRVWEANLKIFFWPENWIEPELRRDKSALFRALEGELPQLGVDEHHAESALRSYLVELDSIARPEILSFFHHRRSHDGFAGQGEGDVLHVFARTPSTPHAYLYRVRRNDRTWSAWEPIELGFQSEYLVPVVEDERLYLHWATIEENRRRAEIGHLVPYAIEMHVARLVGNSWVASGAAKRVLTLARDLSELSEETVSSWSQGEHVDGVSTPNTPFEDRELFFRVHPETGAIQPFVEYGKVDLGGLYLYFTPGVVRSECGRLHMSPAADMWLQTRQHLLNRHRHQAVEGTTNTTDPSVLIWQRTLSGGVFTSNYRFVKLFLRAGAPMRDHELVLPHQFGLEPFMSEGPFFYRDTARSFLIDPEPLMPWGTGTRYRVWRFYHPFTCAFLDASEQGVAAVFSRELQEVHQPFFAEQYKGTEEERADDSHPLAVFADAEPVDDIDFRMTAADGVYNQELFLHIPMLIASRLSVAGEYERAKTWFEFIFDPTARSDEPLPARYWNFRPFREPASITSVETLLDPDGGDAAELDAQLARWRSNPFDPHAIAQLRPVAYQKAVVMKYLDNLIAWADALFRRHTMETVGEAAQLYMLAAAILGDKPECVTRTNRTNEAVEPTWFSLTGQTESTVMLETVLPGASNADRLGGQPSDASLTLFELPLGNFCIPQNEKLLSYWDVVEDRLFKIRHCLDIEGTRRELRLFEEALDPAMLVRAAGEGAIDAFGSGDIARRYRFTSLIRRAHEFAAGAAQLASSLTNALERHDSEALARLRASHEVQIQKTTREARAQRIQEAVEMVSALERAVDAISRRKELVDQRLAGGGLHLSEHERAQLAEMNTSQDLRSQIGDKQVAAAIAFAVPNISVSIPPSVTTSFGGSNVGQIYLSEAHGLSTRAGKAEAEAQRHALRASHERRAKEWENEQRVLEAELAQAEYQLQAARVRQEISERELIEHDTRARHAREVDAVLRDRFSSQELYNAMAQRLTSLYSEAYQLAVDVARRAEAAFQFELAQPDASFITPSHAGDLLRSLLAADQLKHDLRRLEAAYLERNKRTHEIARHVSLARLAPAALMELKGTGSCIFDVPESLFDQDYPGHYMRRLRAVSLTIPAVTGPYASVNCTLTLEKSRMRVSTALHEGTGYAEVTDQNDERFHYDFVDVQSLATSNAVEDDGHFHDLTDERYRAFEGAGAISSWRIDLPQQTNDFHLATVIDVILHMQYTARSSDKLKPVVESEVVDIPRTGAALSSARHDYSDAWHAFFHPAADAPEHRLLLDLSRDRFPFLYGRGSLDILELRIYLELEGDAEQLPIALLAPDGSSLGGDALAFQPLPSPWRGFSEAVVPIPATSVEVGQDPWTLVVPNPAGAHPLFVDHEGAFRLDSERVRNIWIECRYEAAP